MGHHVADGWPPPVGRAREHATLLRELAAARSGRARVVVVSGEAGIGKTHLCRTFVDEVVDFRVLRATGEESEQTLPFGVLDQLLVPAGAGPAAALGPTPLAVGAGLLQLLSDLQSDGPVLLWVDDLQWADPPSQRALLFAVRRLEADAVLVVLSLREGTDGELTSGLARQLASDRTTRIPLDGLTAADVAELAEREAVELGPSEVARLHAHTGGHPLWTLDLLREVPAEHWGDQQAPLPAPTSFAASVAARLRALSPSARALTEASAAAGTETPLGALAAVAGIEEPFAALDQATRTGLLVHTGAPPVVRTSHALVRSAVHEGTPAPRRAELHRALAEVAGTEFERLRHEVLASPGHDADLATRVADLAASSATVGQWSVAAELLAKAARLTADTTLRRDRTENAAAAALIGADHALAERLMHQLDDLPRSPRRASLAGMLAFINARHDEAERLLAQAVRDCEQSTRPDRDALVAEAARTLSHVLVVRGRGEEAVAFAERALDLDHGPTAGVALGHLLVALSTAGRHDEVEARSRHLDAVAPAPEDAIPLVARGIARVIAGRYPEAIADLRSAVHVSRTIGSFEVLCAAWAQLGQAEYHLGRWDEAAEHTERAVAIVLDTQQAWATAAVHAHASFVPSRRGAWSLAEHHVRRCVAAGTSSADSMSVAYAVTAAAVLSHSRGRHDEVVSAVAMLARLENRVGVDQPGNLEWPGLYAEALTRTGRLSEAELFVAQHREAADASGRPAPMSAIRRAEGVLLAARNELDAATTLLVEAIGLADKAGTPFARCLAELELGRVLRGLDRQAEAAAALLSARETAQSLRALPYVAQLQAELATIGALVPPQAQKSPLEALTRMEHTVARLVRKGMSNREIATELFISAKTVEYHLGNAYRKLGVSSRTQLLRELSEA
jgi:DNA-binding CsgD family transcriptional regulator